MNVSIENNYLDLSERFTIEATRTNALFTPQGALTSPLQLPATEHNFGILNHPERADRSVNYKNFFPARIHTAEIKQGRLEIFSVHEKNGIDCTIYFDDGDFYTKAKNFKLNQLQKIRDDWGGNITALLDHLMSVMLEQTDDDFMLFPICVEYDEKDTPAENTGIVLNNTYDTGSDTSERFRAYNIVTETIDSLVMKYPVGYGVTPFLKFHVVLKMAIEQFGYTLLNNPWEADWQLKRMVFLNNTADACLHATSTTHVGMLDYSQLLPATTVTELLDICMAKGYVAYINSTSMTVRFVSVPDIIKSTPDTDLTLSIASRMELFYNNSKQLNLTAGALDTAQPSYDTYEKMWEQYNPYGNFINWDEQQFNDPTTLPNYFNVIRNATGNYYNIRTGVNTFWEKLLSSPYFNYIPSAAPEQAEQADAKDITSAEKFVAVSYLHIPNKNADRLLPVFLTGVRHFNTAVDRDGVIKKEEKQNYLDTSLCYAYGFAKTNTGANERYFFGSTRCYNNAGKAIPGAWCSIDFVTATGYYNLYFKELEQFLKIGIYIIADFKIDSNEVDSLDFSKAKHIVNQPYLIEEVTYVIGRQNIAKIKAWLNTSP